MKSAFCRFLILVHVVFPARSSRCRFVCMSPLLGNCLRRRELCVGSSIFVPSRRERTSVVSFSCGALKEIVLPSLRLGICFGISFRLRFCLSCVSGFRREMLSLFVVLSHCISRVLGF